MSFELLLFSTDTALINRAAPGGLGGVVVDWESLGKAERQRDHDTQVNHDTVEDLQRVRRETTTRVLCRINSYGATTADEIEVALASGADELLLPMVRTPREVEAVLGRVEGRAQVGILVETIEALACAPELGRLPLGRVYVGLMDLCIAFRHPSIFVPLVDGTIDRLRPHFAMPFGFGGLTVPEGGEPIPSALLRSEMVRLQCGFTFLRRSFLRDTAGKDPAVEVARIVASVDETARRPAADGERDRVALGRLVPRSRP